MLPDDLRNPKKLLCLGCSAPEGVNAEKLKSKIWVRLGDCPPHEKGICGWVFENGKEYWSDDVQEEALGQPGKPHFRPCIPNVTANYAFPLKLTDKYDERPLGVLNAEAGPRVLNSALHLQLLQTLAKACAKLIKRYQDLKQIREEERHSFLLNRVNVRAKSALLLSEEFRNKFSAPHPENTFVMSVDIRRSTELMLKARRPQDFSDFITTLCKGLEHVVKESFGVFDKFTGDGIIAFFPEFFTGKDAGFHTINAADKCHELFSQTYRDFRRTFTSVLTNIGLGIGIDFGPTHFLKMTAGGLTVVGGPVVYACRLSSAPPGTTLLNQPAYERISERYGSYCSLHETELEVKHEGSFLAYKVSLIGHKFNPVPPDWAV